MATSPLPQHNENVSSDYPKYFSPKELLKDLVVNGSTPQAFIQLDHEPSILRLNPGSRSPNRPLSYYLPAIDLHQLEVEEVEELHSACKNWGFFLLVNHGVDPCLLSKVKLEIEEFFKLPLEEKIKYRVKPGETQGYGQNLTTSFHHDQKLDWCDRVYMITNPLSLRKPHLFPMLPSSLRETLEAYLEELKKLAMKIMVSMGRALKMEERKVEELFEEGMQSMRMTYYPPHPKPEQVVGITPHSDATGVTILLQVNGVGGLQVKKDGNWVPIDVPPGAFVVNVGDLMEIVSNGTYKSVEHRVSVNSDKERISIATFFNPKLEAELGPSPSLISLKNPPLFKSVGMRRYVEKYFTRKLDGKSYLDEMRINNVDVQESAN